MATILIAFVIIAALVAGWYLINGVARKRVTERHDSLEDAMSDEREPLPSSHLIPDNESAAGDTPEAHDEINPHDIPPGHPGRRAAEHQAEASDGEARTTRGDDDLAQESPSRDERLERPSGERR